MTDASFRASGYALLIEEENDKKVNSKKKTFAPVAFGSKVFSPAQLKMSIYCKEFLAIYHAFYHTEKETENESRSFYTLTISVRKNSTQNNDTNVSPNMVTVVLTDSTNHPKRPKIRSKSQPASKEGLTVATTLFGAERNDNSALPMPKALTASLPTFDAKTGKFDLFKDLFRNNIKLYPHLTELQKTVFTPHYKETPYKHSAK